MFKQKYAFLDRDGTIIWEPQHPEGFDPRETFPLKSPEQVQFMENALKGMQELVKGGYKLVLVTNQSFLGSPRHPKDIFDAVMKRMLSEMAKYDLSFDFIMVCPHGPDEGCNCRKPKIGGLDPFLAKNKAAIDFEQSYMFGDRVSDGEFAKNLGIGYVKIETNKKFILPANIVLDEAS